MNQSNPDDVGILSGLCSASDGLIWSVQPTMDMTLESVYNVLDHIHAELDKMVFKSCMKPSNRPLAEHLLSNIVLQSQGTLDAKYTNMWHVQALLHERADLWQKLKDAWSAGSFKEIRNLSGISVFFICLLL